MDVTGTNFTIADYCNAMRRSEIRVNQAYQRSDKVWPSKARSFLIETILLGYPIPKLYLYQITDVKTRATVKEIVDGQQRSKAILAYFNDEYRISKKCAIEECAGKSFSQLDPEFQHRFLDYSISVDLFVQATRHDIREVFRRINSYTVPLNAEEQRHASYQGEFKWFVYELSNLLDENFIDLGVFSEKQLVRMQDAKLLCDICYAVLNGFATTKRQHLDALYRQYDEEFPHKDEIRERIVSSMDVMLPLDDLYNGPLFKPYQIYSLLLAISHLTNPIEAFNNDPEAFYVREPVEWQVDNAVLERLTALAQALEDPEEVAPELKRFVEASTGTNVGEKRRRRFNWYCWAFTGMDVRTTRNEGGA